MKDYKKEGAELRKARLAAGMSKTAVSDAIKRLDPSVTMGNTLIYDIETGRGSAGPKSLKVRQLMWQVLRTNGQAALSASKKIAVQAPVVETKKITVTANGFSIEASTNVVKQLATLGLPTADVKATLVKTFADLLDQAEK